MRTSTKKKDGRGGSRKGAGRPALPPEELVVKNVHFVFKPAVAQVVREHKEEMYEVVLKKAEEIMAKEKKF